MAGSRLTSDSVPALLILALKLRIIQWIIQTTHVCRVLMGVDLGRLRVIMTEGEWSVAFIYL